MNIENFLIISVTAIITGASNAFGIWLVSRHIIQRIDGNKKGEKK